MKLELLPNELFFEIFQFLNTVDIFYSFSRLNYRFYSLIQNIPLYPNFQQVKKPIFNEFCQILLSNPELKQNLISLKLSNKGTCGQIQEFLSLFPLNEFTHLKSLSFIYMDQNNIKQVLSTLASLTDLYYFYAPDLSIEEEEIVSVISKSKIRVLTLQSYYPISNYGSLSVTSLRIVFCSAFDLLSILKNTSMLKYLKVDSLSDYDMKSNYDRIYESESSKINAVHLIELSLGHSSTSFKCLELLLKCLPNLEIFSIFAQNADHMINGHRWQHLIESSLPKLRVFNFNFDYSGLNSFAGRSIRLSSFQTDFWHKHKWYINFVLDTGLASVYTIPYPCNEYRITATRHKNNRHRFRSPMHECNGLSANDLNEFDNVKYLSLCAHAIRYDSSWYFQNVHSLSLTSISNHDHKNIEYELKIEQIEYLKKMLNLANIKELEITKRCVITAYVLFEILKQMPNISTLKLQKQITNSFYDNHELCELLNKKIKILDFSCHSYDSYFKIEDLDGFCKTFSNVEELDCDIDNVDDALFILTKCSKLSIIQINCVTKPVYRWFQTNVLPSNVYINYQPIYNESNDNNTSSN